MDELERSMLHTLAGAPTPPPDARLLAAWLDGRAGESEAVGVEAALAADPELALALLALRDAHPEAVPDAGLRRARALWPAPPRGWLPAGLSPLRALLACASLAAVAALGHLLGGEIGAAHAQREQQALAQFLGADWLEDGR